MGQSRRWTIGQLMVKPELPKGMPPGPVIRPSCTREARNLSGLSGWPLYENCQVPIFLSSALVQSFNSPLDYFSLGRTILRSNRSSTSFRRAPSGAQLSRAIRVSCRAKVAWMNKKIAIARQRPKPCVVVGMDRGSATRGSSGNL